MIEEILTLAQRPTPTPYPTMVSTPFIQTSDFAGYDLAGNMVQMWNTGNSTGLLTQFQTVFVIILVVLLFVAIIMAFQTIE